MCWTLPLRCRCSGVGVWRGVKCPSGTSTPEAHGSSASRSSRIRRRAIGPNECSAHSQCLCSIRILLGAAIETVVKERALLLSLEGLEEEHAVVNERKVQTPKPRPRLAGEGFGEGGLQSCAGVAERTGGVFVAVVFFSSSYPLLLVVALLVDLIIVVSVAHGESMAPNEGSQRRGAFCGTAAAPTPAGDLAFLLLFLRGRGGAAAEVRRYSVVRHGGLLLLGLGRYHCRGGDRR